MSKDTLFIGMDLDTVGSEIRQNFCSEGRCIRPRHAITKIIAAARKLLPTTIEHTVIFNMSLESGTVLTAWKTATVTPIFKKGTKGDPGNYRPVSLTSVPCKILESIIKDKIMDHLLENNLIRDSQHGFMPGRSCATNLVEFMYFVTESVDEGESVDIFYLDFAKAFDKVPRQRLLRKL